MKALVLFFRTRPVVTSVVALFLLGFTVRLAWIAHQEYHNFSRFEPVEIAESLVTKGTYADAFGPGTGPTAHTTPAHPFLLAGVIRVFGAGFRGYIALSLLSAASASIAYALLPALSIACNLGLAPGLIAGLLGALLPINSVPQLDGQFDAPFTATLVVGLACVMAAVWKRRSFELREALAFGALAGVSALYNSITLAIVLGWLIAGGWLFRDHLRDFGRFAIASAGVVVIALAPWAYRNNRVFGEWIWTRSDFGLELQVSNNDWATPDLEQNVKLKKPFVHPYENLEERARLIREGEIVYNREKLGEGIHWIRTHPGAFASLSARRIEEYLAPDLGHPLRKVLEVLLEALGLVGLAMISQRSPSTAFLLAWTLIGYSFIFTIIQVSPRYRYPIEPLLFFLAAVAITPLLNAIAARVVTPERPWLRLNEQT